MPAPMAVGTSLGEALIDTIKAVTVTARITTAANAVLWTGTVIVSDVSETDAAISISTAAVVATDSGTPTKVKFYNGSDAYQWQTTIGSGAGFAFDFTGNIVSGNSYNFSASSIGFTITPEN